MAQKVIEIKKGDFHYPIGLLDVVQPPEVLYAIGDVSLLHHTMAAIVGSRKCSEYGKQTAMNLGKSLARGGIVTVSGMAKGIDSFGHLGALREGGKTIAVLGCGVDFCYPTENRKLYDQIATEGLLLSEYPPGTKPMPFRFPQRNRIIAGLSEAIAVVEAGFDSGSLITAVLAEDMNRMVYAVPGNITSQWSLGTNKLIADGATPLVVIEDLVRAVGGSTAWKKEEYEELSETERKVMEILKAEGEVALEVLCVKMMMNPVDMNGIVMILEMKGYVATNFGKIFIANY